MSKTVKSDERLFTIMEALKQREEAGVTELAKAVDLPKSSVHVHLSTLEKHDFVVKENGRYSLGLRFLDYGMIARNGRELYDIAKVKVDELSEKTDEQVWCITEENGKAIYLCGGSGEHAIQTDTYVGKQAELIDLAGGRAILANLPEPRRSEIIDGYEFGPESAFSDRETLIETLDTIRSDGIALNTEHYVKGVNAIGAPIIDNTGRVYGALSIAGPTHRLKGDFVENELSDLLLGTTNEIGVNLTYK
ncbi:IclR family transcriptional regulator [Natrarchaeobius oligotrophus]|uniref:IclR family transcriptional regulator n=1 Tax=Natrarchaeobius chitinivorans TaxID=1679083 RepID=A0A3N6PKT0_NATCH|nr:IclR family transcriptional regulator [Natrarchaeobius chitinivorans]RQG99435.1 IclR family transcriptional regulator [Natrarchaeobius chitinivorans]